MLKIAGIALVASLAASSAFADEVSSYGRRPDLPGLKSSAIEINPLDLYAQLSLGVSEQLTVGPTVSLLRWSVGILSDNSMNGYAAGLQATIYLSGPRFTDGWIFQPTFGYFTYDLTVSVPDIAIFGGTPGPPSTYAGKFHGLYGGAVAGYQWVWDELVTLSVGAGVTVYSLGREQVLGATGKTQGKLTENALYGGVNPAVMMNIGFLL